MKLHSRVCPVCQSNDQSCVFAESDFDPDAFGGFAFASRKLPEYMHYRMVACPTCDLLYASPIPPLGTLAAAYQAADYDSGVEAKYAANTYARLLRRILGQLPDRVGALDIGTGDGAFLNELLDLGFTEVVGVEPSEAPIAAAEDSVRPLIRRGLFRSADFARGGFRLVTCFQTIEHLYDPLQMCHDVFPLLKKDGVMLLAFHNHRSISARILGVRSPIFDIEHLQLFSRRSIQFLLHTAGYRDVDVRTIYNRYPLSYWFRLFPLPKTIKSLALAAAKRTAVGRIPLQLPAGNLVAAAFKRTE